MAILKYTDTNGNIVAVNSYKINNVIVSQEKGQSTADVMSQKAVTDEISELESTIATKANSSDVYTKTETDSRLSEKANISDVYSKTESDGKFLTEHQDISNLATKGELLSLTSSISSIEDRVSVNENALSIINANEAQEGSIANTIKIAKTYTDEKVKEESDRAKAAEKVNADAIAILNGNSATDGSINKILNDAKLYTDDKILIELQERTEAIGGLTDMIATKANSSDVYTKAEIEAKGYLTEHQSLTDYAKKTEVANADTALQNDIDANEAAVTAALNKLKQSAGFDTNGNYNNSDYTSLADAIDDIVSRLGTLETDGVIDCGVYRE